MKKEQSPKDEPRQAGNKQSSGILWAPTGSKAPSSGITQPHNAKKEALGPNTNR